MQQNNRPLTYDEKKAAEAAFKGLPCDPDWSKAAHTVYLGISSAMGSKQKKVFQEDRLSHTTTFAKQAVAEAEQMSRFFCREEH